MPSPTPYADTPANRLLDMLLQRMRLRSDAALCRLLQVAPPIISKIRRGRSGVSADVIIRMHEATGMPIAQIKDVLGKGRVGEA